MATEQNFDGKIIIIPGVYSNIKSGIKNPPNAFSYGNLLIIDTGSGAGFGGGAGINGTITSGKNAMYSFDNIDDFRDFTEGGKWWQMAEPLFLPDGNDSVGVSKIDYLKAAETTPATMTIVGTLDASDSDSLGGGSLEIQVRSEGLVGNGVNNSAGVLKRGIGFKIIDGRRNTEKYILQLYRGTYRDLDENNLPIDGIYEADTKPELLVESKEWLTFVELVQWMKNSARFNKYFRYNETASTVNGPGDVDPQITVTYQTLTLASGGTETYSSAALTDAFEIIKDLNTDFVFADKWGADSQHANNQAIEDFIINTSRYKPQLYIASGSLPSELDSSLDDAVFYDTMYTTIVHGGSQKASKIGGVGLKDYSSYLTAAYAIGLEAGKQPQVPITFKEINIDGVLHSLTENEKVKCLQGGLLVFVPADGGVFECLKGINSLQDNENLLNANGTTHSKQLFRIAHQLNKEILIKAKADLLKQPNGGNRNTVSTQDVINWTKNFLTRKIADPLNDNLILKFENVSAKRVGDAYHITYGFVPNSEISFLFFTGLMLDVN